MSGCQRRHIRLRWPLPRCSATGCRRIWRCWRRCCSRTRARLERRFLERLRRLGYDPRERKALAAITPGAAAAVFAARRLPPDFIEQVEYNGRRLAKLNLAPARIVRAPRIRSPAGGPGRAGWSRAQRAKLRRALEQWYFCVVLTLNNAFYQVAEAETQTYHELFRDELESEGWTSFWCRLLESLVRFCRAEAGALYLRDRQSRRWVLRAATSRQAPRTGAVGPGVAVTCRRLRPPGQGALLDPTDRDRLDLALDPAWRGRYRTCWSIPLTAGRRTGGSHAVRLLQALRMASQGSGTAVGGRRALPAGGREGPSDGGPGGQGGAGPRTGRTHVAGRGAGETAHQLANCTTRRGSRCCASGCSWRCWSAACRTGSLQLRRRPGRGAGATERTIVEIRRLISALSPAVLEQLGLAAGAAATGHPAAAAAPHAGEAAAGPAAGRAAAGRHRRLPAGAGVPQQRARHSSASV